MRLAPAVLTLCLMALAYVLDLPRAWGAHPFWSQSILFIGTPLGLALAAAAGRTPVRPAQAAAVFAALGLVAVVVAAQGKAEFAASYAEDRLAGRLWYLGWIATAALAAAALTSAGTALIARRRPT